VSELVVNIPGCPDKALSPNARVHWGAKQRATAAARQIAWLVAKSQLLDGWDGWKRLPEQRYVVDAVIAWGLGRKSMDPTNLTHTLKAYLDGVAGAVELNDKWFVWGEVTQQRAEKGDRAGWVRITVKEA
jgi:hypothetical protein